MKNTSAALLNTDAWADALKLCFRQEITMSFVTGRQNIMIFSRAAINALDNPTHVQLLINLADLTLLLLGTEFPTPDSIQVCKIGKDPINQHRQELLSKAMDLAGWRKGYRYTVSAITLDIANKPALSFNMLKATMIIPSMKTP